MNDSKLTFEARLAKMLLVPFDSAQGEAPLEDRILARILEFGIEAGVLIARAERAEAVLANVARAHDMACLQLGLTLEQAARLRGESK